MDYFEWLNYLAGIVVDRIENRLGKRFNRDLELSFEAAKHSEAMYKRDEYYHTPLNFLNRASGELIGVSYAPYNEERIRMIMEDMAEGFINSCGHREYLHRFNNLGAGMAVRQTDQGMIKIYFTIRLN